MDPRPYDFSFGDTDEEIARRNNLQLPRGGHRLRGAADHRGDVHRDGHRHQRHPAAAGGLPRRACASCSTRTASCSSATRSCAASAAPASCSPSSTAASSRTSSPWPRASPAPTSRSGAMGVSDPIADHFRENVFWGGLTYNAHPLCLAAAPRRSRSCSTRAWSRTPPGWRRSCAAEMDRLTAEAPLGQGAAAASASSA